MWLDILIAVIFIFSTAMGYRRGFVNTFIHTAGWLLSIILAFAWYPKISAFLQEKTTFYETINFKIQEKILIQSSSATGSITDSLPEILRDVIQTAEETLTAALADGISDFLFNVISFLIMIVAIRWVFLFIATLFSKKHHDGFIGFVDGLFGLLAGAMKGIILIYLILALMVPVIGISSGSVLSDQLAESRIAGNLYNNNLVLLIIKDTL